jgi:cytochrome c-type biogenesis protein CcmF
VVPELGSFSLILALCFALLQAGVALWGYYRKQAAYFSVSNIAALGQFSFLSFAMLCLIVSFLMNDMSVIYVREHSHQLLPFLYKVGAAWGGHEGSLLLWCLILSFWTLAFIVYSIFLARVKLPTLFPKIVMVLGLISSGFILFLLTTSNPFQRDFPLTLAIGDDLTPILQDPGLIFHPPMLYLGYVGFAIAFAFAISALLEKNFDQNSAKACRPWVILPWSFLSCGIVLGSWWAYRELGWGGWWFWDPVENASLLPWLSATALIHTLIVCEKRDVFKGWAILLAIVTFALSLLGTFLVRSGILVSVHAFADDPSRGIFLLLYLAFLIGGAFICYSLRIKYLYRAPRFELFSRETFLLINSVIMLSAVATILIGTLYPIVLDALNLDKISVGEPYFNIIFAPLMLPILLLMGFAPHVSWGHQALLPLMKKMGLAILLSLSLSAALPLLCGFELHGLAFLFAGLAFWITLATLQYAYQIAKAQKYLNLSLWSMIVAHLGIAVFVFGVTFNKTYSEERQVKMKIGETIRLAGYQFTLKQLQDETGPNYRSMTASFQVNKGSHFYSVSAEQRIYSSHQQSLSKPGILTNSWRDLYLALGSSLPDGSWSVRIYYKPFVRWIWSGGFMLLLGGLLSLWPKLFKREMK